MSHGFDSLPKREQAANPLTRIAERAASSHVNLQPRRKYRKQDRSVRFAASEEHAGGKMWSSPLKYTPLKQDVCVDDEATRIRPRPRSGRCKAGLAVFASLVAAAWGGYVLGQHADGRLFRHGLLAPAGHKLNVFAYNRTFAMAPTEQTADAWANLFPENGGFIHHPVLASNFSGIAVFHQLHCLEALYYLYYTATGDSSGNDGHHHHSGLHDDSSGGSAHQVTPPAHARHCFDYLRQALMCQADTNLEQYNYELNGVTGWGEKQCRDYGEVMRFAEKWGGNKWA